jgi:hypothetical protein
VLPLHLRNYELPNNDADLFAEIALLFLTPRRRVLSADGEEMERESLGPSRGVRVSG